MHIISLQDVSKKNERSSINEVHLVIMRLLSVFMSRTKSGSKSSTEVNHLYYVYLCNFFVYIKVFVL